MYIYCKIIYIIYIYIYIYIFIFVYIYIYIYIFISAFNCGFTCLCLCYISAISYQSTNKTHDVICVKSSVKLTPCCINHWYYLDLELRKIPLIGR